MVKVKTDLKGEIFGRLTVLEQAEDYVNPKTNVHVAQWLCECSCLEHNKVIVRGCNLKNGHSQSCGCLLKEKASERLIGNTYGLNNKLENKFDLSGEYGIIWSNNTNEEIYFDLEDAEKILKYCWRVGKRGYPVATINNKIITMHAFLGYKYYDHADRNKLNNKRSNLRQATEKENSRNRTKQSNNTSGFIGVSWDKKHSKWESYISIKNRKKVFLGYFDNKKDAIITRLKAEKKYFGEFAPQRDLFDKYNI